MSPFRDAPQVELGPLEVGLEHAAVRAMACLPRGGRVLAVRSGRGVARVVGALGSAGVLAVAVAAAVAASAGWQIGSGGDLAICGGAVIFGGASLAAVLSAIDHTAGPISRRGDLVGREASAVLRRMARLAAVIRRGKLNPGRAAALRCALVAAADPEIAPWIPSDVRGRAELLLARVVAATGGPVWPAPARREVRSLLAAASAHLDEPAPADADLAAMDRVARRSRIAPPPHPDPGDLAVDDDPRRAATRTVL